MHLSWLFWFSEFLLINQLYSGGFSFTKPLVGLFPLLHLSVHFLVNILNVLPLIYCRDSFSSFVYLVLHVLFMSV